MTLSERFKYIFICNPKTGSTAVEMFLREWDPGVFHNVIPDQVTGKIRIRSLNGHIPTRAVKRIMGDEFEDYKVFTFFRNPYEKAVSAYFFYKKGFGEKINFKNKRIFILRVNIYLATFLPFSIWSLIKTVKSNEEYIVDNNGKIIVNYIGRTENLNKDLVDIATLLGVEVDSNTKLRKVNESVHKESYLDYYKNSIHKLLFEKKYNREFKIYKMVTSKPVTYDWRGKRLDP